MRFLKKIVGGTSIPDWRVAKEEGICHQKPLPRHAGTGGLGAVAPHFFTSSERCQDCGIPSNESLIFLMSLVKLYPIIVQSLIYSFIRNLILKLFR